MKQLFVLFLLFNLQVSLPLILSAQKNKESASTGGRFNFSEYSHSSENLYSKIDQNEIKAVRLTMKEISLSDKNCTYIFYPEKQNGNNLCLSDLLLWAIKEKGVPAYDYTGDTLFKWKLSSMDIEKKLKWSLSLGDTIIETDISKATSYLVLESTIIGVDDKVIAVRPIGLCPVNSSILQIDGEEQKHRLQLFWVYFPDIMKLLASHSPVNKVKGVKNSLDLFIKNLYGGADISLSYFGGFIGWLNSDYETDTDTDQRLYKNNFDTAFLKENYKDGIYVDPFLSILNGNPEGLAEKETVKPQKHIPDFSSVTCARMVTRLIDLREAVNYPLYFPQSAEFGNRNLADVIFEGLTVEKFTAYDVLSDPPLLMPLSVQEVEAKLQEEKAMAVNGMDGIMLDTIIPIRYYGSDIKYYMIKEIEVSDSLKQVSESFPVSICPVLEKNDWMTDRILKVPLFEIPFSDENFRLHLDRNNITRFSPEPPLSFLSFILNRKYKTDTSYVSPVSLAEARRELGIESEITRKKSFRSIMTGISDLTGAKLVTLDISKSDTANYHLFYPEYSENGLMSFFDVMRNTKKYGYIQLAFTPGQSTEDGEILSWQDVIDILEPQIMVSAADVDSVYFVRRDFPQHEIKNYLIREIKTGSLTVPVAICPVWSNPETSTKKKMFWIYFSEQLREFLDGQEIIRFDCESHRTYGDFFSARKYKGTVLNEKTLTSTDVEKILEMLK